jgi:hypothetical protein
MNKKVPAVGAGYLATALENPNTLREKELPWSLVSWFMIGVMRLVLANKM